MTRSVTTESAEPILRLRGIGRRFGGVQAVRDVDLDVAHGERRAVLGPNGAGKTTLFNLVAGDFRPTSGSIELMGHDVTNWPARRRPALGLSRTYQKSRLFLGLSVEDNLYLALLGKEGGRLRPFRTPGTRPCADAPAKRPSASGSAASSRLRSARSPTASSDSSRSASPA